MNNHNLEERYKEYLDNIKETSGCTFEEYKYVYSRLMNKHITTGVTGRNELQFIRREIENHTIILEGIKATMLKISDFDYRRLNFDPIEENFGQEKFLNTMASYENRRDSHELIIEYLETKKSELKAPQQNEAFKPDEVLKNEFDKIFKNDIGFTIFSKMFKLYKNETNYLANFSFLFYIMEKDFLVCSQTDFKEFLRNEKYNIEIEKIDSRQWNLDLNKNKKSKLFNSIKERYQSNTIKAQ